MTYRHNDLVTYTGPTDYERRVVHGEQYRVFASNGDKVAIFVHDPHDRFGGVVELPARWFEAVEVATT